MLERKIRKGRKFPRHIVVICSEVGDGFRKFVEWCRKFRIREITVCSDSFSIEIENVKVNFIKNDKIYSKGDGDIVVNVLNHSGKREIVNAIKKFAEKIIRGELSPYDVDESIFETELSIRSQPDIIVKAGKEVSEFLIWQGIYSELYFMDIDWKTIRYIDFLRMLREYQRRERRYGR
ncbi:MAG: undecaprenyl diphosphate synthase family protein [Archaeoglobaceae archaeon]